MKKFLFAIAALTLAACGGAAGAGSCSVNTAGVPNYCINYSGSAYTSSQVQQACSAAKGTYSSGGCATGGGGICTFQKGTSTEYKWTFGTADAGAGINLEMFCTQAGGSFSAS